MSHTLLYEPHPLLYEPHTLLYEPHPRYTSHTPCYTSHTPCYTSHTSRTSWKDEKDTLIAKLEESETKKQSLTEELQNTKKLLKKVSTYTCMLDSIGSFHFLFHCSLYIVSFTLCLWKPVPETLQEVQPRAKNGR